MNSLVETPHSSPLKQLNISRVEAEKRQAEVVSASQREVGVMRVKTYSNIHARENQSLVESGESKHKNSEEKRALL